MRFAARMILFVGFSLPAVTWGADEDGRRAKLAVSKPDEQGRVVVLRPSSSRLHADDPLRLVLHIESQAEDGKRTPLEQTSLSTLPTLASLQIQIKPPQGKQHTLKIDTSKPPKGVPQTSYAPTIVLALEKDKLLFDTWAFYHAQPLAFPWAAGGEAPLDARGVYEFSVSGEVQTAAGKIKFAAGPVKVERGAMGLPSAKDLITKARKRIATEAKRPEFNEPKKGSSPWVFEDDRGNMTVFLMSPTQKWSQERFYASFTAHGEHSATRHLEVGTCVAENTLIETAKGAVAVQHLKIGDCVWGFDLDSNHRVLSTVVAMRSHVAPSALQIGELRVTPNHPIYVDGTFAAAGTVEPNSTLLASSGEQIAAGETSTIEEPTAVYDVTVDGVHNYFADGLLVHNKDRPWWPHVDDSYYLLWPTEKFLPKPLGPAEQ